MSLKAKRKISLYLAKSLIVITDDEKMLEIVTPKNGTSINVFLKSICKIDNNKNRNNLKKAFSFITKVFLVVVVQVEKKMKVILSACQWFLSV